MSHAANGDTVHIHYTGRLDDGTVFDSSRDREPLAFTLGSGQVIPGFDDAVAGMAVGDAKTVTIAADRAYGPKRDEMILEFPRTDLPEGLEPQVGQHLHMATPEGQTFQVEVVAATEESLTLDANHPLAGKDLTFDIELVAATT
ncbi:MAG TPA: peptidylprolyl isomerase [Longimicrobiales bacterium]|nr:peptidylprolyl isomerase [Longimicrobiales bacterium]